MATWPRIKFIWGASRVVRGRWSLGLFGFYDRSTGRRDSGLAISVRGLLCWLMVAVAAIWVVAATALVWSWQRNPHHRLTVRDAFFYPWRREAVRAENGRALIAQGMEQWRRDNSDSAIERVRAGLAQFPRDDAARLTVAQHYRITERSALALDVLRQGLTSEFPGRAFLEAVFELTENLGRHELTIQIASRYLSPVAGAMGTNDRNWLEGRREVAREKLAALAAGTPASLAQEVTKSPAAVAGSAKREWTEKAFFAQLDTLLSAEKWDEANGLILAVHSPKSRPVWRDRRDGELRLAQVRIGHGRGNTSEMLTAAKLYLNGDDARSATILELAREIHARFPERAVALALAVRRKSPDYAPVHPLLAAWRPAK